MVSKGRSPQGTGDYLAYLRFTKNKINKINKIARKVNRGFWE